MLSNSTTWRSARPCSAPVAAAIPTSVALMAQSAVRKYGPVTMIDASDLADDDLIVAVAMMGAPTVMIEKIPRAKMRTRIHQLLRLTSVASSLP